MGNSEVSQFTLSANSNKAPAALGEHAKVHCNKSGSSQVIEVPSFISESRELSVRLPGNRSDWESIKLESGEELLFEKSWTFSIVGHTSK